MVQGFNPGIEKTRINVFVKHACAAGSKQPAFRKDNKQTNKQTEIEQ